MMAPPPSATAGGACWTRCTIPLPDGPRHVERGLFSPSLVHRAGERDELKVLVFLPRYRGQEETLAGHLKLHGVRDHALARGFGAVKQWVRGVV